MDNKRALHILNQAQVYLPAVVPGLGRGGFYLFSAMRVLGQGETIDDALVAAIAAGNLADIPPRPIFIANGREVSRLGSLVATAASRTMAARIANALNLYNPNERGF